MKNYFIVGGDGFAREVYMHLMAHHRFNIDFKFGGFLGHAGYGHTVDYKDLQHLYMGEVSEFSSQENDRFLIGSGLPELRKKIFNDLKKMSLKMDNFISNTSTLGLGTSLGEGNIIISSSMSVDVSLGSGNLLNGEVIVGHDVQVGDFNFFGPRCLVLGSVTIGNYNSIGANTLLLPRSKIGNGNKVAPLSAVYKGCKNDGYYAGNPALRVGGIESKECL